MGRRHGAGGTRRIGMVGGLVLPGTVMAALIRLGHDSCRAPDLRSAPVCALLCCGRGKPQTVHPEQPYEKAEDEQPAEPQQSSRLHGLLIA